MFNLFLVWQPWINFFSDVWVLQVLIFYILLLLFFTKNNYYLVFYLFLEVLFFGLYIALIQGELFTAFLWVIEFTLIFIVIIFLVYLNVEGFSFQIYSNFFFFFFLFIFFYILNFYYLNTDQNILNFFQTIYLWDDYYEAFSNKIINDFSVLTISYYSFNNIELLVFGILLLVGSIICINLNKIQKKIKLSTLIKAKIKLKFFFKRFNFFFIKKQSLKKQSVKKPNIRMFKKKK